MDSERDIDADATSHLTPLLSSDRRHVQRASQDFISRSFTSADSMAARVRRFLQWFLSSKYGHYTVFILVALDVAGIFADFVISQHICEHSCKGENVQLWRDIDDALDTVSLIFSSLFMLELLCSIYAFGFSYFKSKFHILDALSIVASFAVDVSLHGPLEEAGSLIIVLRLFRVFKIVEESSTAAEETMEGLNEKIEALERENDALRRRLPYGPSS